MVNVLRFFQNGDVNGADSERARIAAAQRGDRRAFDLLAGAYTPLLRRFLASRVSASGVDDVLQDKLLAAWTGLPGYTRRAGFKAWLFAIAVHKCTDYYRARGKSANDVPLEQADTLPAVPSARADAYADVEQQMDMQSVLALLPPEQREVLELYYFAELSLPETANALGRNLNTVKYQFYRAHTLTEQHLRAAEGFNVVPQTGILSGAKTGKFSKATVKPSAKSSPTDTLWAGDLANNRASNLSGAWSGGSLPEDDTAERKIASKS